MSTATRFTKSVRPLTETHPELAKRFSPRSPLGPDEVSKGSNVQGLFACLRCGDEYGGIVKAALKNRGFCRACANEKAAGEGQGVTDLLPQWSEYYSSFNERDLATYRISSQKKVQWDCPKCGETYVRIVADQIRRNNPFCSPCAHEGRQKSTGEEELFSFLRDLDPMVKRSDRTVIAPYELDCLSLNLGIAVEYNGDYWHSDEMMKSVHGMDSFQYHTMKRKLLAKKDITLAYVWESDWKQQREKIESTLIALYSTRKLDPILTKLTSQKDSYDS